MAHFKMRTQIAQQTRAFLLGFQTIVRREWLDMFSASEMQKLISGDTVDIDLDDLRCVTSEHLCARKLLSHFLYFLCSNRKHTQYYGGFHDSHKVVHWLWEILKKDFSVEERASFLKVLVSALQ